MKRKGVLLIAICGLHVLVAQERAPVVSRIVTVNREGGDKRVVYSAPKVIEAPNWSPDGKYLIVNSEGKLWRISPKGGELVQIATGEVNRVNNDHGVSPDGKQIVISAGHMYLLPFTGGLPRQITSLRPSYYHGWSPDGLRLAYCANRGDNFDLYDISVNGGEERRLTTHAGYDDGPDYSRDGKWIYFNSDRSGSWDIWRIPAAGASENDARAEQVTNDEWEDWFPHPSPDGKWMVYISFERGTKGHPPNKDVFLRLMPMPSSQPGISASNATSKVIYKLFGGQGTINVNSWAPDSKRFAFVEYELIK